MTDTTQNRKFRYRITKLPKYKRGFDEEQLNVLALAILNEVNAVQADLEYDKHHARRSNVSIDPNFQFSYIGKATYGRVHEPTILYDPAQCWTFSIVKSNCTVILLPTTGAVRELFRKLDIKVEKETL